MNYYTNFVIACGPAKHEHAHKNLIPLNEAEREILELLGAQLYQPYPEYERYFIYGDQDFGPEMSADDFSQNAKDFLLEDFDLEDPGPGGMYETFPQITQFMQNILTRMVQMEDYKDLCFLFYRATYTADKPDPDAYGGGVAVITVDGIKFKTTFELEDEMVEESLKELRENA